MNKKQLEDLGISTAENYKIGSDQKEDQPLTYEQQLLGEILKILQQIEINTRP